MTFSQTKAAQAAAWFIAQSNGSTTILKLMKLLYLADRQALQDLERPITGDRMVSMPHGPVLSQTYEAANGNADAVPGGWDHWMSDRENHSIALKPGVNPVREALDCISDAEFAVLEKVQREFGGRSAYWLRDYTHQHCPEWKNPLGSSLTIRPLSVLEAVGKTPEQARDIADRLRLDRELDAIFAGL